MADDVSFAQEIDEELRAERAYQFWARYSGAIITLCVLIVLASIGSVLWKNHLHDLHERRTGQLTLGVLRAAEGKFSEAIGFYESVEAEGGALATLAALRHAEALIALKQEAKALAFYRDIASGKFGEAPASLRDFAGLEAAVLAGNAGDKTLIPASTQASVYSPSEKELRALAALDSGDTKKAATLFTDIVNDNNASYGARVRAAQLSDPLKGTSK